MVERALQRRAREAQDWLLDACFPLWAERGVDGVCFREALDLAHRPSEAETARVRVQARQTYVFAEAARLGWDAEISDRLVQMGIDAMETLCRRPDGLFGKRVNIAEGALEDDTPDLYDLAFCLFALGQRGYAGDNEVLITETLAALETHLTDPSGGYIECLPRPEFRLQNPHMHLFEASLQLCEATGHARHLERASALRALCLARFIDAATGTLGERFTPESWTVPFGPDGDDVEPGHQFEWVWLLDRYSALTGTDLPEEARTLYAFGCASLDDAGHALQTCKRNGMPVDASRRTWPQTEALKAHIAMWRAGDDAAGARAVTSFDILMDEYLTPEGGWIDHFSADGTPMAQNMPASTGYHVVLAFADMIKTMDTQ